MNSLYSKKEREGDEAPFAHIPLWGLQIRGVVKIHTSCQWQSQRLGGRSPPSLPLTHFKFIYFETVLLCSTQVGLELRIPLLPPSEFWDHRCVRPCSACPPSSFLAFLVYLTKLDFISIIYLSNIQRALDGGVFLAFTETLRGATSPVSSSQHPLRSRMENAFASPLLFCLFTMNSLICFGFCPIALPVCLYLSFSSLWTNNSLGQSVFPSNQAQVLCPCFCFSRPLDTGPSSH